MWNVWWGESGDNNWYILETDFASRRAATKWLRTWGFRDPHRYPNTLVFRIRRESLGPPRIRGSP